MKRRRFLEGLGLSAAGLWVGCGKPVGNKNYSCFQLEIGTGKLLKQGSFSLPDRRWRPLSSSGPGFTFVASGVRVVVPFEDWSKPVFFEGVNDSLWDGSGRIYTLSRELVAWSFPEKKKLWSTPVEASNLLKVDGDQIFLSHSTGIIAFDAKTGKEQWKHTGNAFYALAVGPEFVVVSSLNVGRVLWLDRKTGKQADQWLSNSKTERVIALALLDDENIFVLVRRSYAGCYSPKLKKVAWEVALDGESHEVDMLFVQKPFVLIRNASACLLFDTKKGEMTWSDVSAVLAASMDDCFVYLKPLPSEADKRQHRLEGRKLASGDPIWSRLLGGKLFHLQAANQALWCAGEELGEPEAVR